MNYIVRCRSVDHCEVYYYSLYMTHRPLPLEYLYLQLAHGPFWSWHLPLLRYYWATSSVRKTSGLATLNYCLAYQLLMPDHNILMDWCNAFQVVCPATANERSPNFDDVLWTTESFEWVREHESMYAGPLHSKLRMPRKGNQKRLVVNATFMNTREVGITCPTSSSTWTF